jgi:hypothetical protein
MNELLNVKELIYCINSFLKVEFIWSAKRPSLAMRGWSFLSLVNKRYYKLSRNFISDYFKKCLELRKEEEKEALCVKEEAQSTEEEEEEEEEEEAYLRAEETMVDIEEKINNTEKFYQKGYNHLFACSLIYRLLHDTGNDNSIYNEIFFGMPFVCIKRKGEKRIIEFEKSSNIPINDGPRSGPASLCDHVIRAKLGRHGGKATMID